jgi:hypothetical protein
VQHAHTLFGDEVLLSGESAALGAWDVSRAVPLTTSAATFPVWRSPPSCSARRGSRALHVKVLTELAEHRHVAQH